MENPLLSSREDQVLLLTLNRPESLNALNPALMRALLKALQAAAQDPEVRCVVLTGAGRGFCSGGDRKEAGAAARAGAVSGGNGRASFEHRVAWVRRSMEAASLLHDMDKPTIAMINGPCAGAGLSLAGACDFRFAAESASFTSAFVQAGLSGDYGGSWFWTRILGTAKARRLYLLGEKFDAAEALALGLVTQTVPDAQLQPRVMAIAHQLAALPGAGVAYAKANLNLAESSDLPTLMDREALAMMLSRRTLTDAARKAGGKE